MKLISRMFVASLILVNLSLAGHAQDKKQDKKEKKTEKVKLKAHACTQACHDSGKHVYAHGEKGHTCTSDCKK